MIQMFASIDSPFYIVQRGLTSFNRSLHNFACIQIDLYALHMDYGHSSKHARMFGMVI